MRQQGTIKRILSNPVQNVGSRYRTLRVDESLGGRKSDSSSPKGGNPFAFLNEKLEIIPISDKQILSSFGIDSAKNYNMLREVGSRFLKHFGVEENVEFYNCSSDSEKLGSLIEWFESKVVEHGFNFSAIKMDTDSDTDIDFVVYKNMEAMDWMVCTIYCSPADNLSKEGSDVYKRYIKFISDYMGIGLGIEDNEQNYYLCMLSECYSDEDNEQFDQTDWEKEERLKRQEIMNEYKEGGKFHKLFEEIKNIPDFSYEELLRKLEWYRNVCPDNERSLAECMIDGLPIVPKMGCDRFDFNPESGLFGEENDGFVSVPLTSAILYSIHDGIGDEFVDMLNNDINSGMESCGWNMWMCLDDKMTDADIREFIDNKDIGSDFSDWICRFNEESGKFDNYEQTE